MPSVDSAALRPKFPLPPGVAARSRPKVRSHRDRSVGSAGPWSFGRSSIALAALTLWMGGLVGGAFASASVAAQPEPQTPLPVAPMPAVPQSPDGSPVLPPTAPAVTPSVPSGLPAGPGIVGPMPTLGDDPRASERPLRVGVSPLETIYLRREDGQLVPFIDIPFEVFHAIYQQRAGGQTEELPQTHSLERVDVQGSIRSNASGEFAHLTIVVRVATQRGGWVRVPLGLEPATLVSWSSDRPDDAVVSLDGRGGYEAWVRGGEEGASELRLETVVPVERQGVQSTLELALPNATLSQIALDLPLTDPEVRLGSDRQIPELAPLADGRTRLSVVGPSGDLSIRWQPRGDDGVSGLSVVTDVTVQIDGPDLIRYQAAFDVVSLNGRDRGFLVRLPPGARFDAAEQADLEGAEVDPSSPLLAGLDPNSRYVAVTFPQPLDKPTRVVLFASRSAADESADGGPETIDVGGFDVPGAVRQSGSLLLVGSREWRVDWSAGNFLRQVSLQASDREREGAVARFRFSRAPIELATRIVRNESRSACEPMLDLTFTRDRIQLDAEFRYSFSGPRPETLIVDGRGWEPDIEQLRANRFVRRVAQDETNPERWRIDLDPALAEETLALRFVLSRPMETFGDLSVPLPSPLATTVSAAMVSLRSSDDLEVAPRISPVQGTLVPAPNLPTPSGPTATNGTRIADLPAGPGAAPTEPSAVQWVRIQSLADVRELACRVTVRPRKVDVVSSVAVRVDGGIATVDQTLDYDVRYVPLNGGWLAIDRAALEDGDLVLRLDGQAIGYRASASPLSQWDERWEVVRFELPRAVTGKFRLEASFRMPLPEPDSTERSVRTGIPLLVPLQAPDERTRFFRGGILGAAESLAVQPIGDLGRVVTIETPADRVVTGTDDRWRLEEKPATGERRRFTLTKLDRDAARTVDFSWGIGQGGADQMPRVTRLWVQSLSTPEYRRDRVAMRVVTGRSSIEIELPPLVRLTTVAVDGVERPGVAEQTTGRRLTVALADPGSPREHTIELWYRFQRNRSFDRSIELTLPTVVGVDWIEQVYWEAILPPDEYMMIQPQWLVSENRIEWKWWGWTETPRLSTGDLEAWVGVGGQQPPSGQYHRHLYSGFGEAISGRVWTARRWEVLFAGAGLLFVLGVVAVVFRIDRRPVVMLLIAAIAFAGAAAVQPAGQWLAQLAVLVSAFVAAGAYLSWIVARPSRRWVTRPATAVDKSSPRTREPIEARSSRGGRRSEELATTQANAEVRS